MFPLAANFNNLFRGKIGIVLAFFDGNESIQDPLNMKK